MFGEAREGWRDATMKVGFRSEEFKTILLSSLFLQTVVDLLFGSGIAAAHICNH